MERNSNEISQMLTYLAAISLGLQKQIFAIQKVTPELSHNAALSEGMEQTMDAMEKFQNLLLKEDFHGPKI